MFTLLAKQGVTGNGATNIETAGLAAVTGTSVGGSGNSALGFDGRGEGFATVFADGEVGINVTDVAKTFVVQKDAGSGTTVNQDAIAISGRAADAGTNTPGRSQVDRIATAGTDLAFDYTLDADGGEIALREGVIDAGGEIALRTDGDIVTVADNNGLHHVKTDANFILKGKNIGSAGDPIRFEQTAAPDADASPVLALIAEGNAFAKLEDSVFSGVAITQRDAASDVRVETATGTLAAITGSAGSSELTHADTTAQGRDFSYSLEDEDATLVVANAGGPALFGGDTRLASDGDVVIGTQAGSAIAVSNGSGPNRLEIAADRDGNGIGRIRDGAAGDDAATIDLGGVPATPAQLVLRAGNGIGALEDRIETRGNIDIAAATDTGGIFLRNADGDLRIADVSGIDLLNPDTSAPLRGLSTNSGDVVVGNDGGVVRLGGIEGAALTSVAGKHTFEADVELESDTTLNARDGVEFQGTVDSAAGDAKALTVSGAGTTRFGGAVGANQALASLTTDGGGETRFGGSSVTTSGDQTYDDNVVAESDTTFNGDNVAFNADLDGPGAVRVNGQGNVGFGGNVGAAAAVGGLDVRTPGNIEFTGAQNQSVIAGAGGIALNPDGRAALPTRATVFKRNGDLALETTGAVEVGRRERVAVGGALGIVAARAALPDVVATNLNIDAPEIVVLGRESGTTELADGSTQVDPNVHWVANQMVFSTTPTQDNGGGAFGQATLATQDGEIQSPGNLKDFDVRLINADGKAIDASDLIGTGGRVLDLIPTGSEAVGDPSTVLPRPDPAFADWVEPTPTDVTAIWSRKSVPTGELLAYLECAAPGPDEDLTGDCLPAVAAGETRGPAEASPLNTERARETARLYRRLAKDRASRDALVQSIDDYRFDRVTPYIDAYSFRRYLEESPQHEQALTYLRDVENLIANVQLLDLELAVDASARAQLASALVGDSEDAALIVENLVDELEDQSTSRYH